MANEKLTTTNYVQLVVFFAVLMVFRYIYKQREMKRIKRELQ